MVKTKPIVNCRGGMRDEGYHLARFMVSQGFTISAVALQLGCSRACVRCNMKHSQPPSQRPKHKPPRMSSNKVKEITKRRRRVRQLVAKEKRVIGHNGGLRVRKLFPSCSAIAQALRGEGVVVSRTTVCRDLRKIGMICKIRPLGPSRRAEDPATRLRFARTTIEHLNRGELRAESILFSDEKYVDVQDHGCRFQWCDVEEIPEPRAREMYAMRLHIWGVIGVGFKFIAVLPNQRLTADSYIRRCLSRALPLFPPGAVFVQDGAKAHTAGRTIAYLARKGVHVSEWPARSPDLNPIENIWALLSRMISDEMPKDCDELQTFAVQQWSAIPQEVVNKYALSFTKKLQRCVEVRGKMVQKTPKIDPL